jgi:hypothetical protein
MSISRRTRTNAPRETARPAVARSRRPALPTPIRQQLSRDLGKIIGFVGSTPARVRPSSLASQVDFPAFVAGLIDGVFQAIVDASVQQMNAYADLVKGVAKSVDAFAKENVSSNRARDWLIDKYVELAAQNGDNDSDDDSKTTPRRRRANRRPLTRTEQRNLAAAVTLVGIDRLLLRERRARRRPKA